MLTLALSVWELGLVDTNEYSMTVIAKRLNTDIPIKPSTRGKTSDQTTTTKQVSS